MADKVKIGKIIIDDKFKLRVNTGDSNHMIYYMITLLLAAALVGFLTVKAKRK